MTDDGPSALEVIWSATLSVGGLILSWFHVLQRDEVKSMKDQISAAQKRADDAHTALGVQELNAARTFATKADVRDLGDKLDKRFDRLDDKIDELSERLPPKHH